MPSTSTIIPPLEETIVTAERRQQALLEVPVSIAVISAEQLNESRLITLNNVSERVSNFQAALPNGEVLPIFSIRGVSMSDYSVNQSSPISVYLDEINLTANYTHGLPLYELQRVEVLRGPQGTLYGRNATGGAINLISNTPDFDSDGYLKLAYGNYAYRSIDAAYETPLIGDVLAARLAVSAAKGDGYVDNHYNDGGDLSAIDRRAARLTFNWQSSDDLSLVLRLNSGRSDPETQAVIAEATNPSGLDTLSEILSLINKGYRRPDHYDASDTDSNKVDKTTIKTDGGSVDLNWDFVDHTLTSITGYYKGDYDHRADSDGMPIQLLEMDYLTNMEQWSQDLRISSEQTDPLAYTVGIYFAKDTVDTHVITEWLHDLQDPNLPPSPVSGFTTDQRYNQDRKTKAAYGQLSYNLSQPLVATIGLRYTEDDSRLYNVHTFQGDYDGSPLLGLIPGPGLYAANAVHPSQSISDHEWTGTLKLNYSFSDDLMTYISYSRGYRSGAFNGAATWSAAELAPVAPETINAYEIGSKGRLFGGAMEYSGALFYYDYRDQQFLNVVGTQQLLDSARRSTINLISYQPQKAAIYGRAEVA